MGCNKSKLHPNYADIHKLRKEYDMKPIRSKNLVQIWVLGAIAGSVKHLASLISNRCDFELISASDITSAESARDTERGTLINTILQDVEQIPTAVMIDLVTELLLAKIENTRGIVMIGIPNNITQAAALEKLIGPVSLIIYMEIHSSVLKAKLLSFGDDEVTVRKKLKSFYRHVIPLTKHKKCIKVNGEKDVASCLDECKTYFDELSRS